MSRYLMMFAGEAKYGDWIEKLLYSGIGALSLAAKAYEPSSGRVVEVLTTQPGWQFYTGKSSR